VGGGFVGEVAADFDAAEGLWGQGEVSAVVGVAFGAFELCLLNAVGDVGCDVAQDAGADDGEFFGWQGSAVRAGQERGGVLPDESGLGAFGQ
jgi:hypothetical protein